MESPIQAINPQFKHSAAASDASSSPRETWHLSRSESPFPVSFLESPKESFIGLDFRHQLLFSAIGAPHGTLVVVSFLGLSFLIFSYVLLQRYKKPVQVDPTGNNRKIHNLKHLKTQNKTASILFDLVQRDGAGAWPPKATHDSWPPALRAYKDIYLELIPLLPTAEPSLDDEVNRARIQNYRTLMRKLLEERVDIAEVESIMAAVEDGKSDALPNAEYNGFYACIAACRHAYRWATNPVVKVAQMEKTVDFPKQLEVPWPYLQRHFGVTADSGNITANILLGFDENGERRYKINVGMSESITASEETFSRMFYDVEVLAFPIYYDMVCAIACYDRKDIAACLEHLENITFRLRHLLKVFYENLVESRISRSVWLSYVQGYQGWGIGRIIDGEFIKFDGLSGNHVLAFQAIDAFLGMDKYLTDENMIRHIPVNQRRFCEELKRATFRHELSQEGHQKLEDEFQRIANHMRLFRAAHRTRVMPYLEQPAPERLMMTAGKSVLEGPATKDTKEALKGLDEMLVTRLKQTI